jgi:acyl-CoA dehydrogenase
MSTNTSSHPVTTYIGESAWSLVRTDILAWSFPHMVWPAFLNATSFLQIEPRFSSFAKKTLENLIDFLETECLPAEHLYHAQIPHDPVQRWKVIPPVMEELKRKAKSRGLWNLFLSKLHYPEHGVDLTNLEVSLRL